MPLSKKTAPKKVYKKRVIRRKTPMNITKTVNQVLARKQETKRASTQYTATSFNGYVNGASDFVNILPTIQIGTGDNNRIGSTIQPVKIVIKGHIIHNPTSFNTAPRIWGIRHMLFQDKSQRSVPTAVAAGPNLNLLDIGGTSTQFNGTIQAYEAPHNSDQFMWYRDKRLRMIKPYGITNSTTLGMTSVHSSMYLPFTITLTQKQLPASFKYDANSSNIYPTNFAPFMSVGYCDLTGNSIDVTDTSIIMAFTSTVYFKDS